MSRSYDVHPNVERESARIGLNAQLLSLSASYRGAGIAHYIHQLLLHLPEVSAYHFTAFVSDPSVRLGSMEVVSSGPATQQPLRRILWEQAILPRELARRGMDLLHALAFVGPVVGYKRWAVTVYDISFALFPEAFRPFNRWYLNTLTRRSVRRANAVIAISESTRRDLVRRWGVPEERVRVAYCGVDASFHPLPQADVRAFLESRGLTAPYILFVGTLEPRKNVARLVEAFALLKKRGLPHKLVLAGGKGWLYDSIFAAVERLGIEAEVVFPGFVPRNELPMWYNGAALFAYPSLYEGFGLGPLEAMACGTPVVVSNRASLPEVVGDAGLLVDAEDVSRLAAAMEHALMDRGAAQQLRERGLQRASRFTWEGTARETAAVYASLLADGERGYV